MTNNKMIKNYLKYIKDNPRGYWFRAKWYGWGWVPAKWQGLAVLAVYIFLAFLVTSSVNSNSHSVSDILYGATIPLALLTIIFIVVCYVKGEKPHWSWGPKSKKR